MTVHTRGGIASTVAALLAAFLCVAAAAQNLPAGWTSRPHEGGTLYEPNDLPPGSTFSLWSAPPTKVGDSGNLQAFTQVKRESLRGLDVSGMRPQCQDASVTAQGGVMQACRVEGGGKPPFNIQFVMLPPRDGQARWMRIVTAGAPALLERYKDGFGAVFSMETKRALGAASTSSTPSRAESTKPAAAKAPTAADAAAQNREDVAKAIRAEPGKGVKPDEMETVLFSWQQVYRVTGLAYEETIYLLFKDGTAYEELELAPEDFNAKAARQLQAARWVQWRKSGKTYEILRPKSTKWEALQAWPAIQARRDEKLDKTFTNYWYASMGGLGGSSSTSSYKFSADGRFEQFGHTSHGTGVMQSLNGFSANSSSSYSKDGTQSTSTTSATGTIDPTASPAVVAGGTRRRNDGAANTGTYRLDGWAIELHRDNGQSERRLFLFPHADRSSINIGGTHYKGPDKDKKK